MSTQTRRSTAARPLLIRATLTAALATACAQAMAHPPAEVQGHLDPVRLVENAERYAPGIIPDRIVLTWADDPRTTQTVTWRTSTEVAQGIAEFAKADHGPAFPATAARVLASSEMFTSDLSTAQVHRATFRGLEPGTVYAYRVGDGVNWTEWNQFRTEPASAEPFSFVYFGDAQNDIRSMWSRVTREAFRDAPRAAFFLHAGDLVNRADSDGEWGEWFEAGSFINTVVPVIATPGNHEYVRASQPGGREARTLTRHFPAVFTFPRNGPQGLESTVYATDYGDATIISLNSNEKLDEQVDWLDSTLARSQKRWKIVTFHHPVFSMGKGRDNPELRRLWKPVLDAHAVDLVLTGHDHTYARSGLVGPGNPPEALNAVALNAPGGLSARSQAGTVYVVSVSGPKMYEAAPNPGIPSVRRAEDTQLYQVISINGDELTYEARTAVGALYDSFLLRKRPGSTNELIERPADLGPRRR